MHAYKTTNFTQQLQPVVGNDDLFPMVMQYYQNEEAQNQYNHEQPLAQEEQAYLNEIDEGVFHYDQAHESLEEEIFELHTQTNKDLADEQIEPFMHDDEAAHTPKEQDKNSPLSNTDLPKPKTSSSQKLVADVESAGMQGGGDEAAQDENNKEEKFEGALDGVAVEAKCATSNESSSDSRGNKDLLGMMNEELEHETELLYE